jgi:calcineurin-like phosphoesterase family protein
MNDSMLKNWNATCTPNDSVYFLGDFGFGNAETLYHSFFKRLNGKVYFLPGNHDTPFLNYLQKNIKYPHILPPIFDLNYNGQFFCFSHYPIENWNGKYKNSLHIHGEPESSIHIHGHTHNSPGLQDIPNRFNVSMDCIGFVPVKLEDLIAKKKDIKDRN